jgi:hypothetical protein
MENKLENLRWFVGPMAIAARTVLLMAGGTAPISAGIPFETPFFWDSLEAFCDAPVCPTW